jgi:hypothetical protein
MSRWSSRFPGSRFADEDEAVVWVGDMKLRHTVVAVEEVSDAVAAFEGLHMLPERVNVGDLDIDLGVAANALHDLVGGCLLEVDGLAVTPSTMEYSGDFMVRVKPRTSR